MSGVRRGRKITHDTVTVIEKSRARSSLCRGQASVSMYVSVLYVSRSTSAKLRPLLTYFNLNKNKQIEAFEKSSCEYWLTFIMKWNWCLWHDLICPSERHLQFYVTPLLSNSRAQHIKLALCPCTHSSAIVIGKRYFGVRISHKDLSVASWISSDNVPDISTCIDLIGVWVSLSQPDRSKWAIDIFSTDKS